MELTMGYIVAHISKHQGYGSTVISKLIKMGLKKNCPKNLPIWKGYERVTGTLG